MLYLLSSIYRSVVPASIREPMFRRRTQARETQMQRWNAWIEQPLGGPLDRSERRSRAKRYRRERRIQAIRMWLRFRRQFDHEARTNAAFKQASVAASYYEKSDILPDHVMYESYNGRDFAGNPYAIFLHTLDHPRYEHLHHVIAVDDVENVQVSPFANHPRVTVVESHSDRYIRYAETCKYFINNASYKPYLIKRPEQIYFTTWHSTLLKRLAKDAGRRWDSANVARALVASDIHLSPNSYTTELLFSAHDVDGLVHGRVYEMGYPRNDLTLNADTQEVRQRLGVPDGKRVALYAPTWRGDYVPEDTAQSTLDYAQQIRDRLPDDYVLYVNFHTLVYSYVDRAAVDGVVPPDIDTNELLAATDLLVTDYSGIFFDYLLTGNPVLFFTPDREAYARAKQGFYMPLEDLPGPLCDDLESLEAAMKTIDSVRTSYAERYAEFVDRFLPADDGEVCERATRLLFDGESFDEYLSTADGATPETDKKTVLFYPANMAGNGVTESFIALMDTLDHDRINAVIMLPDSSAYRDAQRRLHPRVKVFYQNSPNSYLRHEYIKERTLVALGGGYDDVPVAAFRRTMRRIFADLPIDIVVNYNGYFPNAAAMLAVGVDAEKHVIYLHNDLEQDRVVKHPQLLSVFSLYEFYDRLVCVSADSLASNSTGAARRAEYVFGIDLTGRLTYSRNLIMPDEIRRRADAGMLASVDDQPYLLLRDENDTTVHGVVFDPANFNFVCVGRLSPEKNHSRLLHAFERVARDRSDVKLYIVGTGKQEEQIRGEAHSLGLQDKVVFTGFMSNPLALVDRADCFVLASDIEGQPITILEALVLHRPVIATDIPGPRDLLADGRGTLVPPSVGSLAAAMREEIEGTGVQRKPFDAAAYVAEAIEEFYALV